MKDGKIVQAKIYSSRHGEYAEMMRNGTLPVGSQLIPCGHCRECRMQYARNWADRCMLEASCHERNIFLTLTYDNDHIVSSCDTGAYTLVKKDLQDFHKKLRIYITRNYSPDARIRFFACGEYGSETHRPHYHDLIFGFPFEIPDLHYEGLSKAGSKIYSSELLGKIWTNGKVYVGEVNWKSCAYVARYVVKKSEGVSNEFYDSFQIQKEFVLMSRRPGIGRQFYDSHKSMYAYDCVYIPGEDGGIKVKPPRYFDKLFEVENPDEYGLVKARRAMTGKFATRGKLYHTDLSYSEYLAVEEKNAADRTKIFKRNDF